MPILIWGLTLLIYRLIHYGIASGFPLLFDHWFLILGGVFILKKSTRLQVALTYLIFVIQAIWIVDNLFSLWLGNSSSGITAYLFQPGLNLFEFLLLQSHFILPAILLYKLPEEDNNKIILPIILLFPAILFLLSFFTPLQNDINCIHTTCSPLNTAFTPWANSAIFAFISCLLIYILSECIRRVLKIGVLERQRKNISIFLLTAGLLASAWNFKTYLSNPKFTCLSSETESAKISCLYSTDYNSISFAQHYSIKIKGNKRKECTPYLTIGTEKGVLQKTLLLPPNETHTFSSQVPFPKESIKGLLEIDCHDFIY